MDAVTAELKYLASDEDVLRRAAPPHPMARSPSPIEVCVASDAEQRVQSETEHA
jgi:hypothetical protein